LKINQRGELGVKDAIEVNELLIDSINAKIALLEQLK